MSASTPTVRPFPPARAPVQEPRRELHPETRTAANSIGIVVPALNEAAVIEPFLAVLCESAPQVPVVVVDGGSSDGTVAIAARHAHTERLSYANRGAQLNFGARRLDTDVLLFLHADSQPPAGFEELIRRALADPRVVGGCFRLAFDSPHPMLRFYSWFTQFSGRFFHFGDQGFFVRRSLFEEMGGYRELPFLEDVDFLKRLRRRGKFVVIPAAITTSARRFLKKGIVRQQLRNIAIVALFELGVSAQRLAALYPHIR